jgi:hypothetical protein
VAHIKKAETGQSTNLEQFLLEKLLLYLFDLDGLHLAAVWCEFSGGLFA